MTAPVAVPDQGPEAPPRANGELAFEAPWQGRAFGLCVALLERSGLGWDAFRPFLVTAIDRRTAAPYYDCFAEALEAFAADRGLFPST